MDRDDNRKMDEGLQGNETIEQAIRELQQAPSGEELAHTLTVVRRRMKEGGSLLWRWNRRGEMEKFRFRQFRRQMGSNGGRHLQASRKN